MKIGLIGRIAKGAELVDGQTIKTKILLEELIRIYPEATYNIVDSYKCKSKIISYIVNVIKTIKNSDVIFILLSSNGIKITFPIISLVNKIYNKPILHDVIGGRLDVIAKKNPLILKSIKNFYINMVESQNLANKLKYIGVDNVEVVPNFKRIESISEYELKNNIDEPFKFCTFSRVSKSKGIGEAITSIKQINAEEGYCKVCLDIYGPIESEYEEEFNLILQNTDESISYKGCVNYNDSVDILKNYSALLFPTTFYGEGFPGTLIDAFSAGLPVIATDWHCNSEIIDDGENGLLYPASKPEQLTDKMYQFMNEAHKIHLMKRNCIKKSREFHADIVMKQITNIIDKGIKQIEK